MPMPPHTNMGVPSLQFEWKHCKDMVVGETYEVHWPHSAAGACGTRWQYQEPFVRAARDLSTQPPPAARIPSERMRDAPPT
eukprot:2398098-Prymnesium_polylepis.1